jgi:excisionase family DNA binding protein
MNTTTAGALLRTRGAAQFLNVSEFLVRQIAKEGEIKFIQRTPRSPMLFSPSDLEKWIQKNKQ